MSTLSGEKVQEFLFEEGLDFAYSMTANGDGAIDVVFGNRAIRIEKIWYIDKDWVMDIGDIDVSIVDDGNVEWVGSWDHVTTERELVAGVVELVERG